MKNIATVITALRKEKGWSQTDLARESSISREDVGKYERGEAAPSIDFAKRIADALGVTLDYHLVGEGQSASWTKKMFNGCKPLNKVTHEKNRFALLDASIRDFRAKQQYAV